MKKTRKLLSILLALVMALSLCTVAFAVDEPVAEEEFKGVLLPTSPDGLAAGALWLDWAALADYLSEDEEIEQEELDAMVADYSSYKVYFDADTLAVKVFTPVFDEDHKPVIDEATGEQVYAPMEEAKYLLYEMAMVGILKQVGTDWVLVKPADAELADGDYYFDKDAVVAAYRKGMEEFYLSNKPEDVSEENWKTTMSAYIDENVADFEEEVLNDIVDLFVNKAASELFQWKATIKYPKTEYTRVLDPETGEPVSNPVYDDETGEVLYYEDAYDYVPVLDEAGNPVFEEATYTFPFFIKVMLTVEGEGIPAEELAMSTLPYDSIKAGIKQYKVEKPVEPEEKPDDKPADNDKDEDGGYSNNAFMKFINKIIEFFKGIFDKITGIFKK